MTIINLTKVCSTCKKSLPVEFFHANKAKKDGRSSSCKECHKIHSRKHYENHKSEYFARNQQVRKRQKERVLEIKKDRPCADCGQKFHPYIMEFDHREPPEKKFNISQPGQKSERQFQAELDKCDLVCSNCHKMRTFKRHKTNKKYVLADSRF